MKKFFAFCMMMILTISMFAIELSVAPYESHKNEPPQLPVGRGQDSLYFCSSFVPANSIGFNTSGAQWAGGIRLTPTELASYAGWQLVAVVIHRAAYTTIGDTINVYDEGTSTTPGTLLHSQAWVSDTVTWNLIDLTTFVTINGSTDLWIMDRHTEDMAGFPMSVVAPPTPWKGDVVWDATGGWATLSGYGLNYDWLFIAIVSDDSLGIEEVVGGAEIFDVKAIHPVSSRPGLSLTSPFAINAKIDVLDLSGRYIGTLFNGTLEGTKEFNFETETVGTYIYRAVIGGRVFTGKWIVIN